MHKKEDRFRMKSY